MNSNENLDDVYLTEDGSEVHAVYETDQGTETAVFRVNTMIVGYETTGTRAVAQGEHLLVNGDQKEPLTEDLILDFIYGVRNKTEQQPAFLVEKVREAGGSKYEYMADDIAFLVEVPVEDRKTVEGIFTRVM